MAESEKIDKVSKLQIISDELYYWAKELQSIGYDDIAKRLITSANDILMEMDNIK